MRCPVCSGHMVPGMGHACSRPSQPGRKKKPEISGTRGSEPREDPLERKAWLTTHASSGRKPTIANVTVNNMDLSLSVHAKHDGGFQAFLGPLSVDDLRIIRSALNRYWSHNGLED